MESEPDAGHPLLAGHCHGTEAWIHLAHECLGRVDDSLSDRTCCRGGLEEGSQGFHRDRLVVAVLEVDDNLTEFVGFSGSKVLRAVATG